MDKNNIEKNTINAKMFYRIDATIKQALATFRNVDKAFFDGYIMLLYVNNAHSILCTRKSIW